MHGGIILIKFENVDKVYSNGVKGLNKVSLEIEQGEFVAIIGLSGAGKSTLLRADAQSQSIEMIAKSAEKNFTDRAQKLRQFEVAEKVLGGSSTKFILPANGDIVSVLNLEGKGNIVPIKK